ncbi:MAG: hypothetical protein ACFFDW_08020 [Candidatus Thorarchaeota archaeon]
MRERILKIILGSVVGAFTSFLLFALVYYIFAANPIASGLDGYKNIVLFALTIVLPVGGFIAGKIIGEYKFGILGGVFSSLGFFILSSTLIIMVFYWNYEYNIYLFFEEYGIFIDDPASRITDGFIWGHSLIVSSFFTGIALVFNIISGFIGGKLGELNTLNS